MRTMNAYSPSAGSTNHHVDVPTPSDARARRTKLVPRTSEIVGASSRTTSASASSKRISSRRREQVDRLRFDAQTELLAAADRGVAGQSRDEVRALEGLGCIVQRRRVGEGVGAELFDLLY